MTLAAHPDRPINRCASGCRHDPLPAKPVGGRCAYYEPNRPGQICGRAPVAVYVNDAIWPPMTYRCPVHDREVNRPEAKRLGFRRLPVGGQA